VFVADLAGAPERELLSSEVELRAAALRATLT
jgi:hypothetical protein